VPNSSGAEDEDQRRLARAYNNSVYLMAGMPYLLLGVVGFLVYRGLRERARLEQLVANNARHLPAGTGQPATHSPAGDPGAARTSHKESAHVLSPHETALPDDHRPGGHAGRPG
jgi:hypothetical protein